VGELYGDHADRGVRIGAQLMPELSAAPSINDTRTQALLKLITRLAALDLTPLLVYRIDSVPEASLPFLAWQFDILSPLWQLVAPVSLGIDALTDVDLLIEGGEAVLADVLTEAAQRELLKSAVPLHRFRGTPFAVKQALAALGWTRVNLLEGQTSWGGAAYPSSQGWAVFRVMIELRDGQSVPGGAAATAAAAANFFKPARAWLDSIWFVTPPVLEAAPMPADKLTLGGIVQYQIDAVHIPSDDGLAIAIVSAVMVDDYGPAAPIYDRHYRHSGITYGVNEPEVADSALVLNGAAVLHGG
jgi:P2-related tail formation protein